MLLQPYICLLILWPYTRNAQEVTLNADLQPTIMTPQPSWAETLKMNEASCSNLLYCAIGLGFGAPCCPTSGLPLAVLAVLVRIAGAHQHTPSWNRP